MGKPMYELGMNKAAQQIAKDTGIAFGWLQEEPELWKGKGAPPKRPSALPEDAEWRTLRAGCNHCGYYNENLWTSQSRRTQEQAEIETLEMLVYSAAYQGCKHLRKFLLTRTNSSGLIAMLDAQIALCKQERKDRAFEEKEARRKTSKKKRRSKGKTKSTPKTQQVKQ